MLKDSEGWSRGVYGRLLEMSGNPSLVEITSFLVMERNVKF